MMIIDNYNPNMRNAGLHPRHILIITIIIHRHYTSTRVHVPKIPQGCSTGYKQRPISTTHWFHVFHRSASYRSQGPPFSNALYMLGSDTKWKRSDWLNYWSTSKAWTGKFAQIPKHEDVPVHRLPPEAKKLLLSSRGPKKSDENEGDSDYGDDDDVDAENEGEGDEELMAAEANLKKAKLRFRPEQLPVRYLVDMLLIYGRAWKNGPNVQGMDGKVVVVDPFCGSATAAMAAHLLDCPFIGLDTDPNAQTLFHGYGNKNKEQQGTYQRMVDGEKFEKVHTHALPLLLLSMKVFIFFHYM